MIVLVAVETNNETRVFGSLTRSQSRSKVVLSPLKSQATLSFSFFEFSYQRSYYFQTTRNINTKNVEAYAKLELSWMACFEDPK